MEELTKVSHKLAEEIYKQAAAKQQQSQQGQAEPGAGPAGARQQDTTEEPGKGKNKDEDIIDAEYKEEDNDGKK